MAAAPQFQELYQHTPPTLIKFPFCGHIMASRLTKLLAEMVMATSIPGHVERTQGFFIGSLSGLEDFVQFMR
jgi:hypothetical protein